MRAVALVSVCAWFLLSPSIYAQDPPSGPPSVIVQLLPGAGADAPREIVLGPRAVGLCKKAGKFCSDSFTFMWTGPPPNSGEKIQIEFVTPGSADCLEPTFFALEGQGAGNKVTVSIRRIDGQPLPSCPPKVWLSYEVSCVGGEGGNCGGVAKMDPGAMVEGG